MTGLEVAVAIAAATFVGWAAALVRALVHLSAEVKALQSHVEGLQAAEDRYARLWLPEPPLGGPGGEKRIE